MTAVPPMLTGRLAYLSLQATREGQASHAHVHEIIAGLRHNGWDVRLFEPSYARAEAEPGSLRRALEFVVVQCRLALHLLRGVDVVYMRNHFGALPTSFLAKLLAIPVVQEVNGPYGDLFVGRPWTRRFSRLVIWSRRTQLRWATAIIAVTSQLRDWAVEQVGTVTFIEVIPNGANHLLFQPGARSDKGLPDSYAIFFGALAGWQGVDALLDAVDSPAWPSSVRLVIVGDGAERAAVERAAARNPRIVFLGRLPYREMPGVIAGAVVGLSPQSNVGGRADTGLFPLKVFETLACGVPVIVTDYPGQADLVRAHRCGLVVEPGRPEALAEGVRFLFANVGERKEMGRRGRQAIETEHSWERRAAHTDALLRRIKAHDLRSAPGNRTVTLVGPKGL